MVKIKKLFALLAAAIVFFTFFYFSKTQPLYSESSDPSNGKIQVTAQAALIMEYDSGEILWEKNSTQKLYPASTTIYKNLLLDPSSINMVCDGINLLKTGNTLTRKDKFIINKVFSI